MYVGQFKDDKFHGKGTMTYKSGNKYVGRWKDDKLSMRLKFKEPYGPTKLSLDLFGPGATDSFDTIILDSVAPMTVK